MIEVVQLSITGAFDGQARDFLARLVQAVLRLVDQFSDALEFRAVFEQCHVVPGACLVMLLLEDLSLANECATLQADHRLMLVDAVGVCDQREFDNAVNRRFDLRVRRHPDDALGAAPGWKRQREDEERCGHAGA